MRIRPPGVRAKIPLEFSALLGRKTHLSWAVAWFGQSRVESWLGKQDLSTTCTRRLDLVSTASFTAGSVSHHHYD